MKKKIQFVKIYRNNNDNNYNKKINIFNGEVKTHGTQITYSNFIKDQIMKKKIDQMH